MLKEYQVLYMQLYIRNIFIRAFLILFILIRGQKTPNWRPFLQIFGKICYNMAVVSGSNLRVFHMLRGNICLRGMDYDWYCNCG